MYWVLLSSDSSSPCFQGSQFHSEYLALIAKQMERIDPAMQFCDKLDTYLNILTNTEKFRTTRWWEYGTLENGKRLKLIPQFSWAPTEICSFEWLFLYFFHFLTIIFLICFVFLEFCVNMTCRGTKYGTAHMLIQINITSDINFAKDITTLNLRRIKTCQKGIKFLWMLHVKVFLHL